MKSEREMRRKRSSWTFHYIDNDFSLRFCRHIRSVRRGISFFSSCQLASIRASRIVSCHVRNPQSRAILKRRLGLGAHVLWHHQVIAHIPFHTSLGYTHETLGFMCCWPFSPSHLPPSVLTLSPDLTSPNWYHVFFLAGLRPSLLLSAFFMLLGAALRSVPLADLNLKRW